ncbi:hypothetical protein ACFL3V_02830 [Nanoarchaeota archaeon]
MDSEETAFGRLERLATVEFQLTCTRQTYDSGFVDTIGLELSPTMDDISGRREFAQACLDIVDYKPLREDLYYVQLGSVPEGEYGSKFFKAHDGGVYSTEDAYVDRALRSIAEKVDLLVNHPWSQCTNVSVVGLEYFEPLHVKSGGALKVIECDVPVANPCFNSLNLGL